MRQLLDAVAIDTSGGREVYRCLRCEAKLGAASGDWRRGALAYDEPIGTGEPEAMDSGDERFVLRHRCCPSCATLFEVEMIPRDGCSP